MNNEIAINICTPNINEKWGDNSFAENLKLELEKYGYSCTIFCYQDWDLARKFPITITITGKHQYIPNPKSKNIIWNISHPEMRTASEFNAFDLVLIASEEFYNIVKDDVSVPIYVFLQATNSEQFFPLKVKKNIEILFVGNNYYDNLDNRIIIADLLKTKYKNRFLVVGENWAKGVPQNQILGDFIDYDKLNEIYARTKIVLNDHHGTMKIYGFINNRTFDLCAAKAFQISDHVAGLEKFGITHYKSAKHLEQLIDEFIDDEFARKRNIKIANLLTQEFRFSKRAEQLDKFIKEI